MLPVDEQVVQPVVAVGHRADVVAGVPVVHAAEDQVTGLLDVGGDIARVALLEAGPQQRHQLLEHRGGRLRVAVQPVELRDRRVAPARRVQAHELGDRGLGDVGGAALQLVAGGGRREVLEQQHERRGRHVDVGVVHARRAHRQRVGQLLVEADLLLVAAVRDRAGPAALVGGGQLRDERRRPGPRLVVGQRQAQAVAHLAGPERALLHVDDARRPAASPDEVNA